MAVRPQPPPAQTARALICQGKGIPPTPQGRNGQEVPVFGPRAMPSSQPCRLCSPSKQPAKKQHSKQQQRRPSKQPKQPRPAQGVGVRGRGMQKIKACNRPKKRSKNRLCKNIFCSSKCDAGKSQAKGEMRNAGHAQDTLPAPRMQPHMLAQPIAESVWFEIKCRRCGLICPSAPSALTMKRRAPPSASLEGRRKWAGNGFMDAIKREKTTRRLW